MIAKAPLLLSVAFYGLAVAYPAINSTVSSRGAGDAVCGTTQDADLAACQSILNDWKQDLVTDNVCHFGGFWRGYNTAYNVASVPGCSVYVAGSPDKDSGAVKEAVQTLMGCADKSKGKVNGVTVLTDGTFICVGGNDGCGDCFDDSDINNLPGRRRSLEQSISKRSIDPGTIVNIGSAISDIISNAAGEDNVKRENVVRNMVDGMAQHVPNTNVVACHTEHEAKFDGEQGKDWIHEHFEVDIQLGGTIGYELYIGGSGTFKRIGDGGYINWGWNGVLAKDAEDNGSFLTFASRD